jgi:hypothetical protein
MAAKVAVLEPYKIVFFRKCPSNAVPPGRGRLNAEKKRSGGQAGVDAGFP